MSAEVDNSDLDAWFKQLEAKAKGLKGVFPEIGEILVGAVSDVYRAQGPGWKELDERTIKRRRKGGVGHKILQDTGLMAASTDVAFGADWVEAFAGVSYAEFHARGEGVPKRNPFDLGPFEADVLEEAAEVVANAVAQ